MQVGRTDAVHWRDDSAQDVIQAVKLGGGFNGQDIFQIFHDADGAGVPLRVGTDFAQVAVGDVVAFAAFLDVLFQLFNTLHETVYLFRAFFE